MSTPTHDQRVRSAIKHAAAEIDADSTARMVTTELAKVTGWAEVVRVIPEEELPLPRLMGATEAAEALGVTTSNLGKVSGLVAAVVLTRGSLYRAVDVARLARERAARRAEAGS